MRLKHSTHLKNMYNFLVPSFVAHRIDAAAAGGGGAGAAMPQLKITHNKLCTREMPMHIYIGSVVASEVSRRTWKRTFLPSSLQITEKLTRSRL